MSHFPHSDLGLVNIATEPSPLRELGGGINIVMPSISCTPVPCTQCLSLHSHNQVGR